jgi:hypothetical protein
MVDDDARMDALLRSAMTVPEPELSAGFDRRLIGQIARARPSRVAYLALSLYALCAVGASAWVVLRLPAPAQIPVAAVVGLTVAAGIAPMSWRRWRVAR